ncbi:MAG: hypothetical protein ACPGD5_01755 [Salibacteraceae bacterium]
MRLGQLARQLKVTPKDILNHIEKNFDVEIKTHPNSKIPDELIDPICNALGNTEIESEEKQIQTEITIEPAPLPIQVVEKNVEIPDATKEVANPELTEPIVPLGKIETEIPVIEGPKVVGKIELSESDMNRTKQEPRIKRERPKRVRERPTRAKKALRTKRSLSDEEIKNREIKKQEALRKASEESQKQLNKQEYLKKLKQVEATKAVKKKKKKAASKTKVIETTASIVNQKAKPKGVFGKLWGWLNDA